MEVLDSSIWFKPIIGKFINFNDPKKSAKECLQLAKDYFFNAPKDAQKIPIGLL